MQKDDKILQKTPRNYGNSTQNFPKQEINRSQVAEVSLIIARER